MLSEALSSNADIRQRGLFDNLGVFIGNRQMDEARVFGLNHNATT
jgi:hypothetical protein